VSYLRDEVCDEQAYVCTDCLVLIANGDWPDFAYQYPDKSEEECAAMLADYKARIEREMHGFRITLGWGREQHACASNVRVTVLRKNTDADNPDEYRYAESKEYREETASAAIESAEFDFIGDDVIGFRAVMHDLETESDRGGECFCEEISFDTRTCDHCGDRFGGTWHAATVWRILCPGSGVLFDSRFPACPECGIFQQCNSLTAVVPNHSNMLSSRR
jgi:hypothetical protein